MLCDTCGSTEHTTKGHARRERKAQPPIGPRDDADDSVIFTDSARGRAARARWARRYDALNGAPESEDDR